MSRGERIGLSVAAFGIGVTVVSTALGIADVEMSAAALWAMGGLGVVLMLGGVVGALVSWRQRDGTPDEPSLQLPIALEPGIFKLSPEPQQASEPERVRLLREAYQKGVSLRERLVWAEGAPHTVEEAHEAAGEEEGARVGSGDVGDACGALPRPRARVLRSGQRGSRRDWVLAQRERGDERGRLT